MLKPVHITQKEWRGQPLRPDASKRLFDRQRAADPITLQIIDTDPFNLSAMLSFSAHSATAFMARDRISRRAREAPDP
jgi:hypothetical protein